MDIIYGVSVMGGGEDNMCWQPAKSRGFEVSNYYQVFNTASNHSFPWKSIWKPKVPYSPFFFFVVGGGLYLWRKFQQLIIYEKKCLDIGLLVLYV